MTSDELRKIATWLSRRVAVQVDHLAHVHDGSPDLAEMKLLARVSLYSSLRLTSRAEEAKRREQIAEAYRQLPGAVKRRMGAALKEEGPAA